MVSKQTSIINATGLHARPASVFVTEAKKYQCNVTIKNVDKDSAPVNAKSIMMILAAGLGTGTKVEVACDGADEQELWTPSSPSSTLVSASRRNQKPHRFAGVQRRRAVLCRMGHCFDHGAGEKDDEVRREFLPHSLRQAA